MGDHERPELHAQNLLVMAEVSLARGNAADAIEQLRAVQELSGSRRAAASLARAEWGLARAARANGRHSDASGYAQRALAYFQRQAMPEAERIQDFLDAG